MKGVIKCKAKHKKQKDGHFGCYYCGGFGIVLEKHVCLWCNKFGWFKPLRGMTVSEGKQFTSFDGFTLVAHMHSSWTCLDCEKKK